MSGSADGNLVQKIEGLLESNNAADALERLAGLSNTTTDPYLSLLKGDALRRVGRFQEARCLLREACRNAREANSSWYSGACWSLGLTIRAMGEFKEAAGVLLDGLEVNPSNQLLYHALQFTRLEDVQINDLLPRLSRTVESVPHLVVAQQILAEWERRCGIEESSLIRSYRAARLGTSPQQRKWIDLAGVPSAPEAILIGAPKCGTTSLMGCLNLHPQVWAHPRKELHFFDSHWHWGKAWYFCQFPVFSSASGIIRLEATPNYLQLPEIPERVRHTAPDARLIVILRDPLRRALSWFHHMQRQEGLKGDPVDVLQQEMRELEAMATGDRQHIGWRYPNCLAGSLYHILLPRWQTVFEPEQLLVVCLEDLIEHPQKFHEKLFAFLGLPCSDLIRERPVPILNNAPSPYEELPDLLCRQLQSGLLSESRDLWASSRIGPLSSGRGTTKHIGI